MTGFDVVVVGSGAAGLSAALGAAEQARAAGQVVSIALLERADEADRGGNTRYSPSYMRLSAPEELAPGFAADMVTVSGGRSDCRIIDRLTSDAVATLAWVQGYGVQFHLPKTYFLTAAAPRIQPIGGGAGLVRTLTEAARAAGVTMLCGTTAERLRLDESGAVAGLDVSSGGGAASRLPATAVILACGGYEASREMLAASIGRTSADIRHISPGTSFNRGEGIRMALDAGAQRSGDWSGFHCEPVDPRSSLPEAVVLVYPYGIVVNRAGQRFCDEGSGRVDETWEALARTIAFEAEGQIAFALFDRRLQEIPDYERAIKSDVAPWRAETIGELAVAAGIEPDALASTIAAYNAAASGDASRFDPLRTDGLRTQPGLIPAKSNWARPIDRPPFFAYPIACAIAYTFGGIATTVEAEVVREDGVPIRGLYAAGEINGLFFGRAPGGTSVLRGLVFGRIAGRNAAEYSCSKMMQEEPFGHR